MFLAEVRLYAVDLVHGVCSRGACSAWCMDLVHGVKIHLVQIWAGPGPAVNCLMDTMSMEHCHFERSPKGGVEKSHYKDTLCFAKN